MRRLAMVMMGTSVLMSGCMTSTKVQDKIEVHNADMSAEAARLQQEIDALKQSVNEFHIQHQAGQEVLQMNVDAAKVLVAANTVKMGDLDARARQYQKMTMGALEDIKEMKSVDERYRRLMIQYFTAMQSTAGEALSVLAEVEEPVAVEPAAAKSIQISPAEKVAVEPESDEPVAVEAVAAESVEQHEGGAEEPVEPQKKADIPDVEADPEPEEEPVPTVEVVPPAALPPVG